MISIPTTAELLVIIASFILFIWTSFQMWRGPDYSRDTQPVLWRLAFEVVWNIDDLGGGTARHVWRLSEHAKTTYGVSLLESPYEKRSFPEIDPLDGLKPRITVGRPSGKTKVDVELVDGFLKLSVDGVELEKSGNVN